MNVRQATHDDYDAVAAFTSDLWTDRGGDYIPGIYHEWIEDDDEPKKTFVAEVDDGVVGIVQAVMLSSDEAWIQGMRVDPDYRRRGVSQQLNEACFAWARDRGAIVARIMVFSWNTTGLGAARGGGYEPVTAFRWAHPEPELHPGADAAATTSTAASHTVTTDPAAAWRYWTHSDGRVHLDGLGLTPEETWALRELTRADFERFADETAVFAVDTHDGLAGAAYRNRTYDRESDDGEKQSWAEYGVGVWADVDSARSLFSAIARDAAELGVDRTRVLIPETVDDVSDAAAAGVELSEASDFVLGIDLTASR